MQGITSTLHACCAETLVTSGPVRGICSENVMDPLKESRHLANSICHFPSCLFAFRIPNTFRKGQPLEELLKHFDGSSCLYKTLIKSFQPLLSPKGSKYLEVSASELFAATAELMPSNCPCTIPSALRLACAILIISFTVLSCVSTSRNESSGTKSARLSVRGT